MSYDETEVAAVGVAQAVNQPVPEMNLKHVVQAQMEQIKMLTSLMERQLWMSPPIPEMLTLKKDFAISGKIGEPQDPCTLSYASVQHQLDRAGERGFTEKELVQGVVKSIAPKLQLKAYLEGRGDIALVEVMSIWAGHYAVEDGRELYQRLCTAVQDAKESPTDFILRVTSIRQRALEAGYSKDLVPDTLRHTLMTGLKEESLRWELKSLPPGASDCKILEVAKKRALLTKEVQAKHPKECC